MSEPIKSGDPSPAAWPEPEWTLLEGFTPPTGPWPYPSAHVDPQAISTRPQLDPDAWIAPNAIVYGRVRVAARASIWWNCVVRGDHEWIDIGPETNIQDGSVLHVAPGLPCLIGPRVTVGHMAVVHAATVEEGAMIGIGAKVLNGAHVGAGALVAAGAVVLEGTSIPAGTLWAGCPARQLRELNAEQRGRLARTWQHYINNLVAHRPAMQLPDWTPFAQSTRSDAALFARRLAAGDVNQSNGPEA